MTTYTETQNGFNPLKLLLSFVAILVGILILAALVINATPGISHAVDRHGADAVQAVTQCMTGNEQIWINPQTGYHARFCDLDVTESEAAKGISRHGIEFFKNVNGQWEQVTAFIRNSTPNTASVEEYLVESGYVNKAWLVQP